MTCIDFLAFGIMIDDIVFPDGRTQMGVLGGGGPQAALGMRLWSDAVGLIANVGDDLPGALLELLQISGIDLSGLHHTDLPTPRAWQVLEADGLRTQLWRVPAHVIAAHLKHPVDRLPQPCQTALAAHIGIHPLEPDYLFIDSLRNLGLILSIEPFKAAEHPPTRLELERLVQSCSIFSPNLEEAQSLVGTGQPTQLTRAFLDAGADVVALRMGNAGALVACRREPTRGWHIPAVPIQGVNPVGAGNAFCGGFLTGWQQEHDLISAGCRGVVSASFLVEHTGLPMITPILKIQAKRRFDQIHSLVKEVAL
jgi:sugar/nucleoside kinase (ribokinase family)